MHRLILVCLIAIAFLIPWCSEAPADAFEPEDAVLFKPNVPPPPQGETFTFVVMGDTRPHGGKRIAMPQQFLDNIAEVNRRAPVFSVNVGDLIVGYSEDIELVRKQWDAYLAATKTFKQPLFSVVGNHDVSNEKMEHYFIERFGDLRWYSFDYGPAHFIVLDSDVVGQVNKITGEQLEWLKKDLEASRAKRLTFVFLHRPLWREGGYGTQWNDEIHPLLAKHGATVVFAGHEHWYQKDPARDGVAYYVTGGGGAELHATEFEGGFYHFMEVTVEGDKVSYAVNRLGKILSDDVVTRAQVEELRKLRSGPVKTLEMPTVSPAKPMDGTARFELTNPTPYTFEYAMSLGMPGGGRAEPDKAVSGTLAPGESAVHEFRVTCPVLGETRPLRSPVLRVEYTVACEHSVPRLTSSSSVPVSVELPSELPEVSPVDRAAKLDGKSAAVRIPFVEALNVSGPFTLEAWFNVESLGWRVGAMTHTEGSSYGLFLAEGGKPQLRFLINDAKTKRYTVAAADEELVPLSRWAHIACTYDGATMAVWLDGKKVAEAAAPEKITPNKLPMYVGADVMGTGAPTSFLKGQIDEFRFSTVCRYDKAFTPVKHFTPDKETLVLYHLDRVLVNRVLDYSGNALHGILLGEAVLVER